MQTLRIRTVVGTKAVPATDELSHQNIQQATKQPVYSGKQNNAAEIQRDAEVILRLQRDREKKARGTPSRLPISHRVKLYILLLNAKRIPYMKKKHLHTN
ncbi:hypothetical protein P7K49_039484 [Saguinus oedipus]|uniref:Uncharacterized protein n=1 Tax=Saguinus oedipus TaxID=9490 RepID=A0ABQ9TBY4_SAGOE|nr:hypothetical protein P7K49_039484 [Saguinus oedipus]